MTSTKPQHPTLIHNISEDQIVDHESNIHDNTVVFDGNLKIRGFEEHVSPSLRIIYGNFDISESHISDLANLERITGSLKISSEKINKNNEKDIFINTDITSLKNLVQVDGDIYADDSELRDLGKLKNVGGWLNIRGTGIWVPEDSPVEAGGGIQQDY